MPENPRTREQKKEALRTFIPAIMAMDNAVTAGGDLNALPPGWERIHAHDFPLTHHRADLYKYQPSPDAEPQFFCLQRSVKNLEDVFFNTLPVLSRDASFSRDEVGAFIEECVQVLNQQYGSAQKQFTYTDLNQLGYSQGGYLMGFALGYIYNKTGDVPEQIYTLDSAGESVALEKSIDVYNRDAASGELRGWHLTPDTLPDLIDRVHKNAAGIFVFPPNLINSAGARLGEAMWASPFNFSHHDAEKLLSDIDKPSSPVEWLVGFLIYHTSELLFEKHKDEFPGIEPGTLLEALRAFCYSYAVSYTEQSHLLSNHLYRATRDMDHFMRSLLDVENTPEGYRVPQFGNHTLKGDPADSYFYYLRHLRYELLEPNQEHNVMGFSAAEEYALRYLRGENRNEKDGHLALAFEAEQAGMDYDKIQRFLFQPALKLVQKVVISIPFHDLADDLHTAYTAGQNSRYHESLPRWAAVTRAAFEALNSKKEMLDLEDGKFIFTELLPHLIRSTAPVRAVTRHADALRHEVRLGVGVTAYQVTQALANFRERVCGKDDSSPQR
ncbi:MAG: hypothetical protein IT567_05390 [Alphaproteobacteria bacterium]|nr:hypothetical protein [Alphaproteobacteria bacterium]